MCVYLCSHLGLNVLLVSLLVVTYEYPLVGYQSVILERDTAANP